MADLDDRERDAIRRKCHAVAGDPVDPHSFAALVLRLLSERDALAARVTALTHCDEMQPPPDEPCGECVFCLRTARNDAERERDEKEAQRAQAQHWLDVFQGTTAEETIVRLRAEKERDDARELLRQARDRHVGFAIGATGLTTRGLDDWRARVAALLGREGT